MTDTVSGATFTTVMTATPDGGTGQSTYGQGFLGSGGVVEATTPGANAVSQGLIILNTSTSAADEAHLPGASGSSVSLPHGPSAGVAAVGSLFAPVSGATVGGAGAPIPFLGGSDAITVAGGSGESTMLGVTGETAAALLTAGNASGAGFFGSAGTPHVPGGTGSNLFIFIDSHAGAGASPADIMGAGTLPSGGEPVLPASGLGSGGDLITLSDGTVIQIQGINHSLFG